MPLVSKLDALDDADNLDEDCLGGNGCETNVRPPPPGVGTSPLQALSEQAAELLKRIPGALLTRRTVEIWSFVVEMATKMAYAQRSGDVAEKERVGDELCEGLLRLGPTFIKVGQILSTRYDILPYDYVKGLEKLQDRVPSFDGELAYQIVCEDFGPDAFRSFERTPIAAASLGQVHLAETAAGVQVAVKVQRPGLRELFSADLQNLRILAEMLRKLDQTPDSMLRDWREIFESNARIIYDEIEYEREAENAERFAANWKGTPWVRVPGVYKNLTSSRVLTMEYVPGVKINNVRQIEALGLSRTELARMAGEAFMVQLFRHGYFHCDPHPGNIAVENSSTPRLIFYDFGMMDELSETFRRALVNGFFALYETRPAELVDSLVEGGLLGGRVDRTSVEGIARYFLENFRERLALDRAAPMTRGDRDRMRMETMQTIGNELAAVAGDKPFRYPSALPYVLRAFNALEGVGKSLDPNYDVSRIANKYIKSLIDLRDGSATITAVKKVTERLGLRPKDLGSVVQAPRRVTQVYETLAKMESGELQLRVRALDLERAMVRNNILQRAQMMGMLSCAAIQVGTVLSLAALPPAGVSHALFRVVKRTVWAASAFFGARASMAWRRFHKLQRCEREGDYNEYLLEAKRV